MKNNILLIMDGFGLSDGPYNAIKAAKTPNLDKLMELYPTTAINASESFVGLPDGQMGNSEVGHTNIGAGRVVWQELSRINNDIKNGEFFKNEELVKILNYAKEGHALHIAGLLSDGGVHSHINHLFAILEMAKNMDLHEIYVHCITDGRDVPPACCSKYINLLEDKLKDLGEGKIASIAGRYYAMDRDKRYERLILAYDAYTAAKGRQEGSAQELLKLAEENSETDEFIVPGVVKGYPGIKDNDAFIFFNFRPDRAREITRALTEPSFEDMQRKVFPKDLYYLCFTQYDASLTNVKIAFKPQSLKNTLGEYLSSLGKTQLRIAETEKYAHVTFFFNGGIEEPYAGEDRILVPSPKVATYDMKPEMSVYEVCDKTIEAIDSDKYDFIIVNFANCDMVGHTGVMDAAIKAVEAVDICVGRIYEAVKKAGGNLLITADHGNAETMMEDGHPMTAHTTNPVPAILVSDSIKKAATLRENGSLCDLSPTLLTIAGLPIPKEMEGKSLI